MKLREHIVASAVISSCVYGVTHSSEVALVSFFTGFLVDLDHLFDYWKEHPVKFDVLHFFSTCQGYRLKRVYLLLHSIELLAIAGIITYFTRSVYLLGFSIGLAQHLFFDQIVNGTHKLTYIFIYRWCVGFAGEKVFKIPHKYRQQIAEQRLGEKNG